MGEAILKRLVSGRPDADQWCIESAGTWAMDGYQPAASSQLVMQTMGMDISHHQSQSVTYDLLQQFDLILTMENQHKEGLSIEFEGLKDRIYMLSEMVGSTEDIPDPMGGELADYEETAHKLERMLSNGLDQIYMLAIKHQKKRFYP